ncbi:S-layer family protein [Flavobacterium sp. 9]|uniref:beta strand repeat-containing protein n=1 Tax=Flavobacterium sp. 9 TaxID=2035198 RepID=UPI000C186071|nr:DUF5977 domain-containing protein [Flavobacterium sp. 9]
MILLTSIKIVAQTTPGDGFKAPDFTPKSPEASAFLKYGEYPVDLSTGVPGISLPVYSIKVDDLEIPISLSYHASGIKVSQEATWVGLGWNLNAGAQIILNSRDSVDESDAEIDNTQRDPAFIKQFMLDHPYGFTNTLLKEYEKSRVKDVYSLSSPTVNGSFYIDKGSPVIFPPDAFKVEIGGDGIHIANFTITDKLGNKYLFTGTVEKSVRALTHHDEYTSAWYVDQIITSKNNKIKFTYQDDGEIIDYSESESIGVIEEGKNCGCSLGATQTQLIGQIRKSNENTTTTTKKIKEITFNNDQTKVEFELKKGRLDLVNQNGYLDNIKISQNTTDGFNLVKKVFFEYSYFNADQTGTDAYKYKRLKLDRMYELDPLAGHEFIYSDIKLPIKDSKSQDFFGYYNGVYNFSLIPEHIITDPEKKTVGSARREVNPATIEAGILKEIHYPTKGLTRFNYETNMFYGIDQLNKYVIQKRESSLTGVSDADNPAPPQLPDADGEHDYEGQNCIAGDCLKYKAIFFRIINPKSNFLTYTVTNNGSTDTKDIKYKYCRIYVYYDGLLYDSGKINEKRTTTLSLALRGGDYSIVLESYGADMRIDASLNYTDEDLTPKNIISSGLRIQSIESYDSNNTLLLKKAYEYNDKDNNTISSGNLVNNLGVDFISNSFANFTQGVCGTEDSDPNFPKIIPKVDYTKGYYINSRSKQGFESNSVVYRYVKEISTNTATSEKMYTDYEFTTDADWFRSDIGIQANLGFRRGKILEKKDFRTVGSKTYVVRKEKNTYFDDNSKIAYIKGYKLTRRSFIDVNENANPQQQPEILSTLWDCQVPQSLSSSYVLADYNIPIPWFYQKTSEVSNYFYNDSNSLTGTLVSTINYNYSNPAHLQLTSQTTVNSNGQTLETKYSYASDLEMVGKPFINELKAANMIGIPLDVQTSKGGTKVSEQLTIYNKDASTSNILLPKEVYSAKFPNVLPLVPNIGNLEKKITYDQYDDRGNILQYTLESGTPVSIIWGYNKTQPIAKLENVIYSTIPPETITSLQTLSNADNDNCLSGNCTEQLLRNGLKTFRASLPDVFMSTYTYNPLVGVTSITDPKEITSYYEYDYFGRLKFVKDKDLNVLEKYCYNYKGQQIDCSDNSSTSVILYKSIAKSGSFTKNNCGGGVGSSVAFSQAVGAQTSTISQADADSKGLTLFNTNGQANANSNGTCTFSSIARSGSFTKNNCVAGGVGSSVAFSQVVGAQTSIISQADADAKGLTLFNTNGQANANTNGTCTFSSIARSGSFTKNNCAAGGVGSSVAFSQAVGAQTSIISQADADAKGLTLFNTNGQTNANANGTCTFSSIVKSGSFTKNNCPSGGVGSAVVYTVPAGQYTSTTSQAAADALAQTDVTNNGQTYANTNGTCTFSSIVKSGSFTKNNCASGGVGSAVVYTVPAGRYTSTTSQAAADALAQTDVTTNGQTNANTNGTCTFTSIVKSGSFTKNNCASGGVGSLVVYTVPAGRYTSTTSQAAADALAQTDVTTNGQTNANTNGTCTFSSIVKSGSFTKNNCASGGVGSTVVYTVPAGQYTSTTSQAAADALAQTDVTNNGQTYANTNGTCTFTSIAKSGSFTKNNCAVGGVGSVVVYTVPAGQYTSTTSQAAADALAQTDVTTNGQTNANTNGTCTFISIVKSGSFTKNNCASGGVGSLVVYTVPAGRYTSTTSQAAADALAQTDVTTNGQTNANTNGTCTFSSIVKSGSFTKNNCAVGGAGSVVVYTVLAGQYTSTTSQAAADALAQTDVTNNGQTFANTNGTCTFTSIAKSGSFTKNNCAAGGVGSVVVYTVPAGRYTSTTSQVAADALAQTDVNNNGQTNANTNGTCTFSSIVKSGSFTKNNCAAGGVGSAVVYTVPAGTYTSTTSQAAADALAQTDVNNNGQANANTNGTCTFSSIARSGSFTKNNCASGGVGSSVVFNQAVGAQTSIVSQADADAKGLTLFNTNGQANANANGTCTFSSIARSGSFTKNNCASGGVGSTVAFSQVAGAQTSLISQADADSKGLTLFNTNGQTNANTNGTCTFSSVVKSGSYTKNNCAVGGVGSVVVYTVPAGQYTSATSQAAADALAQTDVTTNGQTYANTNGTCTFTSIVKSGSYTKNNCAAGGVGSVVVYTVPAGRYTSTTSQAAADALAQTDVTNNGQANANTNGTCTFSSIARSGSFAKNNCAAGGVGSSVAFSQAVGAQTSIISQADADSKGLTLFNTNGQANANTNGTCTFSSIARSGSFTKNNCAAGGVGSSVAFSQIVGAQTSIISQADADSKGLTLFNTNGQANANTNGICTFSSIARSGSFTKNNCVAPAIGSSVTFSQAVGAQISTISQADADAKGLTLFNTNGQTNANTNGSCTYYNVAISKTFTRNDCSVNGTPGTYVYNVPAAKYSSGGSQSIADGLAQKEIDANGQNFANNIAECTFYSAAKSGVFVKNNCTGGLTGSSVTYSVPSRKYSAIGSQADADALAQSDVDSNGQAYANTNGICLFKSIARSGSFTKDNCGASGTGTTVVYNQVVGAATSAVSQADADALGLTKFNTDGQANANANGTCTVSFTYETEFAVPTKELSIFVFASSSNHLGATFNFNVNYIRINGQPATQAVSVVLAAGQTENTVIPALAAKSLVSVDLVSLIKN